MKGRVSEHHMGGREGGTGPLSHYGLPTLRPNPQARPRPLGLKMKPKPQSVVEAMQRQARNVAGFHFLSRHPVRTMPRIEIKASAQWALAPSTQSLPPSDARSLGCGVGVIPPPLSFSSSWMGMKYTRLVSPIETMAWVIPFSQVVAVVPTFWV